MGRSNKNRFKYKCRDCEWTGFFTLTEFGRRCRPRCGTCRSRRPSRRVNGPAENFLRNRLTDCQSRG